MGRKVEKPYAGGKWTKARKMAFIRSGLRQLWQKWPPKWERLNMDSRPAQNKKKGERHRYESQCAHCEEWFKRDEVQVDHIIPAGELTEMKHISGYADRLLVEVDDLQTLCKPCHQVKTNEENEARRNERKRK